MSEKYIAEAAKFYGISIEEANRRTKVLSEHREDPNDPICVGCARRAHELPNRYFYEDINTSDPEAMRKYIIYNEGTYNRSNGHFLCDPCYIKNGSPSSPSGWICP